MSVPGRAGVVIAVDGPAGAGKSSVSRGVAERLGLRYLDTGAMYRAMTWWLLEQGVDVADPRQVASRVSLPVIEPGYDPVAPAISVAGVDVSDAVREPRVTSAVSAVSAVPEVRHRMVELQRTAIGGANELDGAVVGIVVEGRDIGTVVCPDADLKVFLTASPAARADRRARELAGPTDVERTLADLERRDMADSGRAISPLQLAEDSVVVDATDLSLEEVIEAVVSLVRQRVPSVQP